MTATTFRADVRAAHIAVLEAQQAATPTLLRKVHPARPGSFPEVPCAYVGSMDETIRHGARGYGLRDRTMTGQTVVLVDALADPTQTADRLDDLVDLLVDRYTDAYAQIGGGNSILEMTSVSDTELELTGSDNVAIYRAVVLGFGSTFKTEGRP